MPTTINEWKYWAQKLDRQWRKREVKRRTPFTSKPTSRPTPSGIPAATSAVPSKPTERQYTPMDIDRSKGGNIGERKTLICWKCRKPGHRSVDCKERINFTEMTFDEIRKIILEDAKGQDF